MTQLAALVAQLSTIVWSIYAAWRFAGRLTARGDIADRVIAAAILFLSASVCVTELLGGLGLIAPLPMLLAHAALGAAGVVAAREVPRVSIPWRASLPASPLGYLVVGAGALVLPIALRGVVLVPVAWDELSYHLFKPAIWLFDRKLTRLEFPYPVSFLAYYPANAELVWTTLMGVDRNDLWLHALNPPLLCVLALIFVQLTRIAGTSREGSWAFAPAMLSLPVVLGFAATGYVEVVLNVSELAGILFALRWLNAEREHAQPWALLCGLACGLAAGTKYAALPVLAVLASVLSIALIARGRRHGVILEAAIAGCAALATGAYWYVRNALDTGNPFYPVPFLDLPYAEQLSQPWHGYSILDRFGELLVSGVLGDAWFMGTPLLVYVNGAGFGWFGCVLFAIALAGVVHMVGGVLRRQSVIPVSTASVLLSCTIATLFTYLRLPYWKHIEWIITQVRFMTPFVYLGTAVGLRLVERRFGVRSLFKLAALGLVLNASQLDLHFPELEGLRSLGLLAGVLVAGVIALRMGKLQPRLIPFAAGLALVTILALVPWRERHRFELLRDNIEFHQSKHESYTRAAEYIADNFSQQKVAVSMDRFEFLSVFTGRAFDVRPIYVHTNTGPAAQTAYMDADSRHEWDCEVWRRNLRASGASALIVATIDRISPWPLESACIEAQGVPPLMLGGVQIYDLRSRGPDSPWSNSQRSLLSSGR